MQHTARLDVSDLLSFVLRPRTALALSGVNDPYVDALDVVHDEVLLSRARLISITPLFVEHLEVLQKRNHLAPVGDGMTITKKMKERVTCRVVSQVFPGVDSMWLGMRLRDALKLRQVPRRTSPSQVQRVFVLDSTGLLRCVAFSSIWVSDRAPSIESLVFDHSTSSEIRELALVQMSKRGAHVA